ncbi:MAG: hypothetical protein J5789_03705, partial [Oscillospiraceae bacterium]|nr:hypothetical protein [Oscillospiraceae bacterium]
MFLKLVKHESHAATRAMLPLLGGLLVMALLARGSIWMTDSVDSTVTSIIGVFLIGAFFLACGAMVVTTMILMMVRFKKSVHSDEGYLTHTLPVGVNSILLSHLLVSFVAVLLSFAAVYLSIRIATLGVDSIKSIGLSIKNIFKGAGIETSVMLIRICCIGAMGILVTILMIAAAISIGHSFPTGKTGKSVLFFFVLYFAQQLIVSIAMVAVFTAKYAVTGSTATLFGTTTESISSTMLWFSAGQYILFGTVYYLLTWFMTKKHLNL